jgi:hypothetical protein
MGIGSKASFFTESKEKCGLLFASMVLVVQSGCSGWNESVTLLGKRLQLDRDRRIG